MRDAMQALWVLHVEETESRRVMVLMTVVADLHTILAA